MARASVVVRPVVPDDLDVLRVLWERLADDEESGSPGQTAIDTAVPERTIEAIEAEQALGLLATLNGEPAGFALVSLVKITPLAPRPAAVVTYLVVLPQARRHGLGRALLAAAAAHGAERGADQVVVMHQPDSRYSQRFYARLGFGPLVSVRAAPITALRDTLGDKVGDLATLDRAARRRAVLKSERSAAMLRATQQIPVVGEGARLLEGSLQALEERGEPGSGG